MSSRIVLKCNSDTTRREDRLKSTTRLMKPLEIDLSVRSIDRNSFDVQSSMSHRSDRKIVCPGSRVVVRGRR
jgi:hypothetical protein